MFSDARMPWLGIKHARLVVPWYVASGIDKAELRYVDNWLRAARRAEAQVADVKKGLRPSEIAVARAQLSQAEVMAANSSRELARQEDLVAKGFVSRQRADEARTARDRDRARVAEPGNAAIIDSYGWVLFRLGKTREALGHLRHAFALQQDADIASHLGQVLWVLGEKEEARKYFDEARRIDPGNRSLQRALRDVGA